MNVSASEENNGTSVENGMESVPPTPMKADHMATAARLEAPESKELPDLVPSGTLLVHFYRYQLIGKASFNVLQWVFKPTCVLFGSTVHI